MNYSGNEKFARFIFSKRHFSVANKTVKYGAFMPPPNNADLSVFHISPLSESEVWEIGRRHVETEKRRLKARADLFASDIYENNLEIIPDTQPHELHANITPFPPDRKERDRLARKLALASELVIIPSE